MCGIVGYLGNEEAIKAVLEGLSLLQNRGYDSVGISIIENAQIRTTKYASTTTNNSLELLTSNISNETSNIAIGHTRWATHGSKTDTNAHPHHDHKDRISLVHNGIIENFQSLKIELLAKGYTFRSSTDTEIIAVLIGHFLDEGLSMAEAIGQATDKLKGTWALVILHKDAPTKLWAVRNGSPLLLGIEPQFVMVASEQIAFHHYIKQYVVLLDHDVIEVSLENGSIHYSKNLHHYNQRTKVNHADDDISPAPYPHWMLKEIAEQPDTIVRAMNNGGRIASDTTVKLGGLEAYPLHDIDHLILLGCGTSYHAGLWSLPLFKSLDIFDTVFLCDGAEFHKNDIPKKGKTAAILLSQSGETKDLQRCLPMIEDCGIISIGVVNVIDSFIARETTCGVYLNAGREVAVASTKSFTSQCVVLSLLAVWFSQNKGTCVEKRRRIIHDLHQLSFQCSSILTKSNMEHIRNLSKDIIDARSTFLLGKGKEEAIAKEGALKIKEIAQIHAEGYSSSALKHGPFGLLEPGLPVIVIDIGEEYREKTYNTVQEVLARNALVIILSDNAVDTPAYGCLVEPNHTFGGLLANICLQLLSYYCAIQKNISPDYPRNLAKVVTVE